MTVLNGAVCAVTTVTPVTFKETIMSNSEYILNNGDKLKLDDDIDWIVVNPEQAQSSCCACVVSVRNAPEGTPRFLYFSNKKVNKLSRDELDLIDQEILKIYPAYRAILGAKVEPIMEGGRCVNAEEHLQSPYPGYFNLASWPDYWLVGPSE